MDVTVYLIVTPRGIFSALNDINPFFRSICTVSQTHSSPEAFCTSTCILYEMLFDTDLYFSVRKKKGSGRRSLSGSGEKGATSSLMSPPSSYTPTGQPKMASLTAASCP